MMIDPDLEEAAWAALQAEEQAELLANDESYYLGKAFNVSTMTAYRAVVGQSWSHM